MLLSTAHFPPVQYFCKIIDLKQVFIESHDSYQRQSYRNRFRVLGANGPLDLSIPLAKGRSSSQAIKEVKLDYSESWNVIHYKTIRSAYNHSPFYEYYMDDLMQFWEKKRTFLFDFNMEIMSTLFELLDVNIELKETDKFMEFKVENKSDFRNIIHPKKGWLDDPDFSPQPYTQSFAVRYGFVPRSEGYDLVIWVRFESEQVEKISINSL